MIERVLGSRVIVVLALTGVVLGAVLAAGDRQVIAGGPQAAAPPTIPAASAISTNDVLKTYCTGCHNARLKTAGLLLDGRGRMPRRIDRSSHRWKKISTRRVPRIRIRAACRFIA
jgi:cytochrome c5